MKKLYPMKLYIAIAIFFLSSNITFAQWLNPPAIPNTFFQTAPLLGVESVGIGDFNGLGAGAVPLSALHINTNWTPASAYFPAGDVFMTDCPAGFNAAWRQFNNGVEVGDIYNLATNNHLNIRANQGDLNFSRCWCS